MAKNDPSGEHGEPGQCKMMIESEDSSKFILAHQDERNAVGETHLLIGVFFKEFQGGNFVFFLRAGDDKLPRCVNVPSSFGREHIMDVASEIGEHLVEDEISGDTPFAPSNDSLPGCDSLAMVLIALQVVSDDSTGVDK